MSTVPTSQPEQIHPQIVYKEIDTLLRRKTPRNKVGAPVEMTILQIPDFPTGRIHLLDASPGGVGFTSPEPLEPGELFVIHLRTANRAHTIVLYRVRWCQNQTPATFRLGGVFVDAQVPVEGDSVIPKTWINLARTITRPN